MAKFLNTTGISNHLHEIIKGTKERLILISPYLQLSGTIRTLLSLLTDAKRDVRIIYRQNKLRVEDNKWLEKQTAIRTSLCENLHATCYLNESAAIITSMNLGEFSQLDNFEMGMFITKYEDPEPYHSTFIEAQRFLSISKEMKFTAQKVLPASQDNRMSTNFQDGSNGDLPFGFCIRTGVPIPFDIDKPLNMDAFKKLNEFTDFGVPEKFCHFSGESSYGETTMLKPVLSKYWKKASDMHHLI